MKDFLTKISDGSYNLLIIIMLVVVLVFSVTSHYKTKSAIHQLDMRIDELDVITEKYDDLAQLFGEFTELQTEFNEGVLDIVRDAHPS